jgi:hypothetical protein
MERAVLKKLQSLHRVVLSSGQRVIIAVLLLSCDCLTHTGLSTTLNKFNG